MPKSAVAPAPESPAIEIKPVVALGDIREETDLINAQVDLFCAKAQLAACKKDAPAAFVAAPAHPPLPPPRPRVVGGPFNGLEPETVFWVGAISAVAYGFVLRSILRRAY